jgi:hypothetical protein
MGPRSADAAVQLNLRGHRHFEPMPTGAAIGGEVALASRR